MGPKEGPSKKNVLKKKEQVIEDRTFGLKNKNKSKKVQSFIQSVEKNVKNSDRDVVKSKEDKKNIQLAKKLKEEELRVLFNEGLTSEFGKKKSKLAEDAKALGLTEAIIDIDELSLGSSSEDEEDSDEDGPTYVEDDTPDAVEVFREKTLEDMIEEQRAKLAAEGKKGTPVTEETFKIWRTEKLAKRAAELEQRVKAEAAKKKGGKGLSVLSGKELFTFNASLFVDDEGAIDEDEEKVLSAETRQREEEDEKRAEAERVRAQEQQMRLAEAQRIEEEVRRARDEARKELARTRAATFLVDGIVANKPVFDIEEYEDLTPFEDDVDACAVAVDEALFEEEMDEDEDDDDVVFEDEQQEATAASGAPDGN